MSKSVILNEDSSWAQTFITVTPQDDGFLREIEDSSIVSGNSDVPLNLDTWNIVLRKSLVNTTRDLIDPKELEKSSSATAECQTYLQGFPKVELPINYRDEATQTLYIGKNETLAIEKAFDDIITVMNDKPLPQLKQSRYVQTLITLDNGSSMEDIIEKLEKQDTTEEVEETSETTGSAAIVEFTDLLNFLIERALWMAEPVSLSSTIETADAEIATLIKYNHATRKLAIDHEVQTSLSCNPKYSNSMLLSENNGTKNFPDKQMSLGKAVPAKTVDTSETIVRSKSVVDNIAEVATSKAEEVASVSKKQLVPSIVAPGSTKTKSSKFEHRRTKDILLVDNPPFAVRNQNEAAAMPYLQFACSPRSTVTKTTNNLYSKSTLNSDQERSSNGDSSGSPKRSRPKRSLLERDERALNVLKNTLCTNEYCPRHVN